MLITFALRIQVCGEFIFYFSSLVSLAPCLSWVWWNSFNRFCKCAI